MSYGETVYRWHIKSTVIVGGDQVAVTISYYWLFACEGVHGLLMSMEANDASKMQEKAAEKYRQHQIAQLQQQIMDLKERRNQLKNDVNQLSSDSVSYCVVTFYVTATLTDRIPFVTPEHT